LLRLLVTDPLLGLQGVVHGHAGGPPLSFQSHSLRPLNALERPADRVSLAAGQFQLHGMANVVATLIGPAKLFQHHAAEIEDPRIAAAALDGGVQGGERFAKILVEERMHAAAVQLLDHRVLPPAKSARQTAGQQHGGDERVQFPHHERHSPWFQCGQSRCPAAR
jgi:hypothetical protein